MCAHLDGAGGDAERLGDLGERHPLEPVQLDGAAGAVRECQRQRRELVRSRLEATLREAREAGLTDEDLDKLFRQSLQAIPVTEVES